MLTSGKNNDDTMCRSKSKKRKRYIVKTEKAGCRQKEEKQNKTSTMSGSCQQRKEREKESVKLFVKQLVF